MHVVDSDTYIYKYPFSFYAQGLLYLRLITRNTAGKVASGLSADNNIGCATKTLTHPL